MSDIQVLVLNKLFNVNNMYHHLKLNLTQYQYLLKFFISIHLIE